MPYPGEIIYQDHPDFPEHLKGISTLAVRQVSETEWLSMERLVGAGRYRLNVGTEYSVEEFW